VLNVEIKRRIQKVGRYHVYLFLLPALSLLFYGWLKAPELNERPDNPHRVAPLHLRGRILDRRGRPLADSQGEERLYPLAESAGSLVGYQLRGRNQTGLEAALQTPLSPPLPPAGLMAALEQDREVKSGSRTRLKGFDVNLTLDAELQKLLYRALSPLTGSVVVGNREGEILAAVSSPSFDPAQVRENWQSLRSDPRSPFIERVGSGLYPATLPTGKPIVKPSESAHRWFNRDPFPGYPNSSAALWLESRLLVTPLMLLEYAYHLSGVAPTRSLHLLQPLATDDSMAQERPPSLDLPQLPTSQRSASLTTWEPHGPAFGESPEFFILLGTVEEELFFAVVVETSSAQVKQRVDNRVVPAILDFAVRREGL
jgi:hypothetical protein